MTPLSQNAKHATRSTFSKYVSLFNNVSGRFPRYTISVSWVGPITRGDGVMLVPTTRWPTIRLPFAPPHPDELHDEEEGLGLLHQLVQVVVAQAVVGEHVGHAARVDVPVHRVFALGDAPHALGHQGVDAGVLQRKYTQRGRRGDVISSHFTVNPRRVECQTD